MTVARADSAPPSELTTFCFQAGGQAYRYPVNFTVRCYGKSALNADKLLKLSEFSEVCQDYGCKFETRQRLRVVQVVDKSKGLANRTEYCDIEGEAGGVKFTTNDFLGPSMTGLSCRSIDFDILIGDRYFRETSKYTECMNVVANEYPRDRCWDSMVEVSINECLPYYPFRRSGNQCYKHTPETEACLAEVGQKESLCGRHLTDVTDTLEKGGNGRPYEVICNAKVNLPVSSAVETENNENLPPTLCDVDTTSESLTPVPLQPKKASTTTTTSESLTPVPLQPKKASTTTSYANYFVLSLLLTVVIEVVAILIMLHYAFKVNMPIVKLVSWSALINLLSLPYMWFVFPLYIPLHNYVLVGEILIVLIEVVAWMWVLRIGFKKALIVSFVANIVSYFTGILVLA